MSRQRTAARRRRYHNDLVQAIGGILPHCGLPLQVEDERVRWTPRPLVMCASLMTWQAGRNLTEGFTAARETVVKMYSSRRRPGWTVEGFLKILAQRSQRPLWVVLPAQLKAAVQDQYVREHSKRARRCPHKKTERPPGRPKTRTPDRAEVRAAQTLQERGPSG